ncbi:MAG: EAL domain-containing protein [Rhizobiaceae bacterium]|nr:EAL domain-containing protein [Rhizobiaceae bacterium]MCV0406466.1 EAL domain-containing protein [Rhizobiaceae bacterium]
METVWSLPLAQDVGHAWLNVVGVAIVLLLGLYALHLRWRHSRMTNEQRNVAELIENLTEGIYRSSLDGRQLSANKALVKLNGYETEAEMLAAVKNIAAEWYVDPTRRDDFKEILQREGHVENFVSEIYRHKTRERIWITESARLVRHPRSGRPLYYEGSVREITETMERLRTEERFRKLTAAVPGVLFQCVFDGEGRYKVPYISDGFGAMTGLAADKVKLDGQLFIARILPDDRPGYMASLERAMASSTTWDHEFRFRTPAGTDKWFRISATIERNADTVVLHGYMNDISVRKRQAMEIEQLAYFDPLTGLPNRRLLVDRLADAVAACQTGRRHGALLYIDLDNFKTLNDTQGHDVGDEYLIQVADKLRAAVGEDDTVARIGGDEFVVILADIGFDAEGGGCSAIDVAQTILADLSSSFHLGVVQHQSSASIGFVVFDGTPIRVEELLKRADVAMYEVKTSGRNNIALFDPETLKREADRYQLIGDLRFAISEHRFELVFRPQLSSDARIRAAQACVRWPHPERGVLELKEFAPIAAQLGLAEDLGRVILTMAASTIQRWRDDPAMNHLRLAVRFGVDALLAEDFPDWLERLVQRMGIDASRLTLSIGESVDETRYAETSEAMNHLRRLGMRFRLDGFGGGSPAVSSLKALPFDEVCIAGRFVTDIDGGHYDRTIVGHLIAMASGLGLDTVADDIESDRQEEALRLLGCAAFQGPRYGPLLPEPLFCNIARANRPAREPILYPRLKIGNASG